ncbi:MAG: class I SAM-dependent methyltransferase [Chloroflexi bacterium]|nr:class I SAM-dependent methyltransferase [Chloroflexota bacterium]
MTASRAGGTMDFYEEVFCRVAPQQLTVERLQAELALIDLALALPPGARLLDLGCGYGRVAIPLAQRGYAVTGLDASGNSLREARRSARVAGVRVRWLHRDMRDIPFADYFQGAICLGAFGVLETDEDDMKALVAVREALQPGGRFLLDHKNREWQVRHFQPAGRIELPDGALSEWRTEIDLVGGYRWDRELFIEADGGRREYSVRERLYTLEELEAMMEAAGLTVLQAWGDFARGKYGPDSPRMIVLAQKP